MAAHEPAQLNIVGLDHLVLRVRDLEPMLAFYCGALGCSIERRQDEIGLVQLRAGAALIDLVPVDGPLGRAGGAAPGKQARNLDHFCLRIAPFDEASIRTQLAAHGVKAGPVESRYGAEGEGPSIYLDDPEGNVVELKGPPARGAPPWEFRFVEWARFTRKYRAEMAAPEPNDRYRTVLALES